MARNIIAVSITTCGGSLMTGSGNVFVEGKAVVRLGDLVVSHGPPPHDPPPSMVTASGNVFANGIGVCRVGDACSCGHSAASGLSVSVN